MFATGLRAALLGLGLGAPPGSDPIVGGEPVIGDALRSTVVIDFGVDLCSGTLVSERIVLTAAHCLVISPPPEQVQIKIGNDRDAPDHTLAVERYALHPDFCADIFECEQDLFDYAYVVLAEPAPADAIVARLPTDQDSWSAAMRTGAPVILAGFGFDERLESGIKRAVEVPLRGFTETGLEFFAGQDGKDACQGDSGGPAYARLPGGELMLVGVNSRGLECGEGGYFGAVPPALCWMSDELGVVWDPADTTCGGCGCVDVSPRREPAGCCSIAGANSDDSRPWGALLLLMLWRRHRRAGRAELAR